MNKYFSRMLKLFNDNKLTEQEELQLFVDMVKTGYVWDKPELSFQARLLIQKGLIQPPQSYVHREITQDELLNRQNQTISLQ